MVLSDTPRAHLVTYPARMRKDKAIGLRVLSATNSSLVPSPKSPCGEGSGDIAAVSWFYGRVT